METVETVERARVYFDSNAGGWCWQLPGRQPVQADSWAAAWSSVHARLAHPARAPLAAPITPGDERVPVVRWWHRLVAP